jgi:hypothetical protein
MTKTIENIHTLNSVVRTGLVIVVLAALAYAGYLAYQNYLGPRREAEQNRIELARREAVIRQLESDLAEQAQQIATLQTALKLLKVDRRLAHVKILDKGMEDDGRPYLAVEFVEVDADGQPLSVPRRFTLAGDRLYIDCWVVKFEDKYIENAEPLRSASLYVFKSIWGNLDGPDGGFALDQAHNENRTAYGRPSDISEFEQKIWEDFWAVSNDTSRQEELGIRAIHGQVNYLQVEPGRVYEVNLRASDGLSIRPKDIPVSKASG